MLIFGGNAFGETEPNEITRDLARRLKEAGHRGIEVSLPAVSVGLLRRLERKVERLDARYGNVGVAGFSAGGTLAARLALSSDRIDAALACYGPLDLSDWFAYHREQGTPFSRESMRVVRGHLKGRRAIAALSGPGEFDTPIIAAFGARDRNVTFETNEASARKLGARVRLVQYAGPHGTVAPREAFDLFIEELERAQREERSGRMAGKHFEPLSRQNGSRFGIDTKHAKMAAFRAGGEASCGA